MNAKTEYMVISDRVKTILLNYPESRDDDNLLIWLILTSIVRTWKYNEVKDAIVLIRGFEHFKTMPNQAYIKRARRRLQAKYPQLRGTVYEKRHNLVKIFHDLMIDDKL